MDFSFQAIGIIHSPFKQKFAIPRQPGLVNSARARLELLAPFDNPEMLKGIDDFSHLWITFVFHQTMTQGWSPQVRPPRLGGNQKIGVFATRSTFRPNPIGLSAVSLEGVTQQGNKWFLELSGVDLLDGTPVIDIKPYIPYSDAINHAVGGYAQNKPAATLTVTFNSQAAKQCQIFEAQYPRLATLISELLAQDPRPAYKKNTQASQEYAVYLYDLNIRWRVKGDQCEVFQIEKMESPS